MRAQSIGIEVELAVFKLRRPVVCDFLPYTKEAPLEQGGTLYHKDASMFEIAMRPCTDGRGLDDAYVEAIEQAMSMLPEGMAFDLVPAVEYSDEELANDPYASVLGCGASENLYAGYVNMPEAYPDNVRYAGMHINIQGEGRLSPHRVAALDATLGLKSVRDWEQDYRAAIQRRRTVYGRAGEFRRKPFGIEYRTLPASAWGQTSGEEVFSLVNQAFTLRTQDLRPLAGDIQQAIDTCDAGMADTLLQQIHRGAV